jgi:hypothetical protein
MFILELCHVLQTVKVPFCLVGGYAVAELNPQTIKLKNTRIPIASLEGLISMKEKSARPQDREDVLSLKAILKARKS